MLLPSEEYRFVVAEVEAMSIPAVVEALITAVSTPAMSVETNSVPAVAVTAGTVEEEIGTVFGFVTGL